MESASRELGIMILAAGCSQRFGGCKQLAEIHQQALLLRSIETARAVVNEPSQVHLILGARATAIQSQLHHQLTALGVSVHINPQWQQGMGTSLAWGVAQLHERYQGVLVVLADQVALTPEHLHQLIDSWRAGNELVCAGYGDILGVPAIFSRDYFTALMQLSGDRGARSVIQQCRQRRVIPLAAAAIDIDTPDDLRHFLSGDIDHGT